MRPRPFRAAILCAACLCAAPLAAQQAGRAAHAPRPPMQPLQRDQPVTFTADRVEYDRDDNLVIASGHVEAWQNDHVLRADRITFDRRTNVAAASGNVVMLEPDGETLFSDYAELTQGLRDGVLRGMRAILTENGRLAANSARRTDGKINELSRAVYSTCNLCRDDPARPPLWQLRAFSAVQDTEHKTIEYRDAFLDIYGVPVAYLPWFSHADPSVKRQSGFLVPSVGSSRHLGAFFSLPYYFVLDGQSDLVLTPLAGADGVANLNAAWRRRFNSGQVSVNLSLGYDRATSDSSSQGHTDGGAQAAVFAKGRFSYDDQWRYGFDIQTTSSRDYLRDFRLPYQSDILTSQAYMEGFGAGAYSRLDARAYQGLTDTISQKNLPYVLPRYQYSYFGEPDALGGRLSVDAGAFNVLRQVGARTQRGSLTAEYARPFTLPAGEQANVTVHLDAAAYQASFLRQEPNYANDNSATNARALPQVALNYRWPFLRAGGDGGSTLVEPIAQFIAAPQAGNAKNGTIPNEDSLDFEFSDANLFSFNRFPGLDRLEGGERANYALHAAWYSGGSSVDGLVGQSYRFHRDDTYPVGSGLAGNASDYVGRVTVTPASWLDFTTRGRLDHDNFGVRMVDAVAAVGAPVFKVTAGYTYDAISPYYLYDQPGIPPSYFRARNEVTLGASSAIGQYKVGAYTRMDAKNGQLVATGASGSYENECFILSGNLYRRYTSIDGDHGDTTVLFQVTFKTVGQVGYHAF